MKRLDPATGEPFKYKTVREDGMFFMSYSKRLSKSGYFVELWLSPEALEQREEFARYRTKNWCDSNKDRHRAAVSQWGRDNPHKVTAKSAKRRSAKMQRTPPWLTKEHYIEIDNVYAQAKQLTESTGFPHHVDHIVPLQGKKVSGLHVPWNLQVLRADKNLSKGNRVHD